MELWTRFCWEVRKGYDVVGGRCLVFEEFVPLMDFEKLGCWVPLKSLRKRPASIVSARGR